MERGAANPVSIFIGHDSKGDANRMILLLEGVLFITHDKIRLLHSCFLFEESISGLYLISSAPETRFFQQPEVHFLFHRDSKCYSFNTGFYLFLFLSLSPPLPKVQISFLSFLRTAT